MEPIAAKHEPVAATGGSVRPILFSMFFFSGFCSLLYQVVWVRLAFAHFGVITPVLSCVLSVFMLGLGIGSVFGGRWARWASERWRMSPAYFYGAAEFVIGIGALAVPALFAAGESYLLKSGEATSAGYLLASAVFIVIAVLPWCIMMGATFPLMMSFIRRIEPRNGQSFSFLYLANVLGATAGTVITALVLVEVFGFRKTSLIAAAINFAIAAVSFALAQTYPLFPEPTADAPSQVPLGARRSGPWLETVLFTTGLTSLAMEVAWTRAFTLVLKTTIYSFAAILATYLLATALGSYLYRRGLKTGQLVSTEAILGALGLCALLPVAIDDPRFNQSIVATLASIVPLCLALGYLTPRLIDEHSLGDPQRAGRAYGVNIAGGILGPLLAAYVLLPTIGTRATLLVLSLPMVALFVWAAWQEEASLRRQLGYVVSFAALFAFATFVSRSYEDGAFYQERHEVRRDITATVTAYGEGMDKHLLVNGVGMTFLSPTTKVMAHLPLAVNNSAKAGLIICFGMGTTFRAMRSWGIDTTVVELSRAVTESFGYFHADFRDVIADPKAHVVVDDGRRYLLRSTKKFDAITLDPPPPIEAAASSLLYSKEFYDVVKAHLAPGGILQQWYPGGEESIQYAVARALRESFPYIAVYRSLEDWGYHLLASSSPIEDLTPEAFVARLPEAARRDLMEWNSDISIATMADDVLSRRTDMAKLLPPGTKNVEVTDDLPYNEYFFLRRAGLMN